MLKNGDIRGMETFKVDDSTAVATSSGYDQIEGSSSHAQLATGSEKEGIFDRSSCLRFKGMITSSIQSNVAPGLASAGTSRAVADSNARKDSGIGERPFPIRPQLASALHARDISCIRPDFSDMIVEQRHDPRILFGKQGERYRQEVRQQKIQQWVLKHNFSQDSLPSDCWPDKYPQTIQGTEHESIESLEKPDSGKQAEAGVGKEPLQQSSGTQSLYSDPRKTTFAKLSTHEPYLVSMATTTADSGIFHASKGALMKKRKMDCLEGTDKSAMALCKKPALAPVFKGSYPSNGDVGSNITLRQWLNRPSRIVDYFECLHIFKQILEFVHLAHAQGIVLRNVRPSSFILSSMHRVSFLDSASSRSTSGSSDASIGGASGQASLLDTATLSNDIATSSEGRALSRRQAAAPFTREIQSFEDHRNGFRSTSNNRQNMGSSKRLNAFAEKAWDKLEVESWLSGPLKGSSPSSQKSSSFGMEPLDDDLKVTADSKTDISISKAFMVAKKSDMQERLTLGSLSGDDVQQDEHFPVWHTRLIEEIWYASPEEVLDGTCSFASDIYCLGVLLFELFCSSSTWEEYSRVMLDLRHRILPSRMLSDRPKEASFCLWLIHPNPNSRPKASELLHSEILNEAGEALVERQAAMNIEEREAETELLLDFLQHVQQQKQELASRLLKDLSCLTSDIQEVERRRSLLKHTGMQSSGLLENQGMCSKLTEHRGSCNIKDSLLKDQGFIDGEASEMSVHGLAAEVSRKGMQVGSESVERQDDLRSKCARLMRNFDQLEQVYFSMRWKVQPSQTCRSTSNFGSQNQDTASASTATNAPFSGSGTQKSSEVAGTSTQESDSLGCFFDSLCKYARFNKFEVRATLRHGDLLNTANMVCSLSFDRDQEYFATAGVCKRIKVFECDAVLNESIDIHYPVIEMTNRSMLSSICWNSYIKSHIASSDYDGVVQLWDASTGQSLMLYEEHEKRAWSVDFSQADPTKLASGSDDGCVKIWTINQEGSIGTIKTNANVCCIQFPRESAHLIAFGSADYNIYCYDLRSTRVPWCILASHKKAVSYVKFLNANTLVSASTDNTLKLWDLSQTSSAGGLSRTCLQSYMGHTNEKNFVGLAVVDGYIACGSESNSVFAYHKSLPMPMAFHKFGSVDPISGQESEDDTGQFVSSVCWRGKSQTLVAANSMGNIKVLEMV